MKLRLRFILLALIFSSAAHSQEKKPLFTDYIYNKGIDQLAGSIRIDSNIKYFSLLERASDFSVMGGSIHEKEGFIRYSHQSIVNLFKMAANLSAIEANGKGSGILSGKFGIGSDRIKVNTQDTSNSLQPPLLDGKEDSKVLSQWFKTHATFDYVLKMPVNSDGAMVGKQMMADLNRSFPFIETYIEKGAIEADVLEIRATGKNTAFKTGKANYNMKKLILNIGMGNQNYNAPDNKTGYEGPIYIPEDVDPMRISGIPNWNAVLNKIGLEVVLRKQKVDRLVIKDNRKLSEIKPL